MKVSVSIPADDIEFLDEYARAHDIASRSAAVQRAIRLLRISELAPHYAAAFAEWEAAGEGVAWGAVAADGLSQG